MRAKIVSEVVAATNTAASPTYAVHTFGCKLNTYDTSWLQQHLGSHGFALRHLNDQPDVVLLNTCAVTEQAVREALRYVRRIKKQHPKAFVVLTGCAAQVDSATLARQQGVDLVVGNSHKNYLAQLIKQNLQNSLSPTEAPVFKSNIFKSDLQTPLEFTTRRATRADSEKVKLAKSSSAKASSAATDFANFGGVGLQADRTRAFLKIQDGCNSFCTFCIIPFARGKSKSLSVDAIVKQAQALHTQGVQEIVLTGVHIGDYGKSHNPAPHNSMPHSPSPHGTTSYIGSPQGGDLADLVNELLNRTHVPRLRLSSLEPIELTPRLMRCFQNPRMCPHFHMSVQSANTKVLKLMKRQYTGCDVRHALEMIAHQVPQAFVGLDVIAGFVGEGDEEFNDTYKTLSQLPWTQLHVFAYSPRPQTWAYNKPAPDEKIRRWRAGRLRELGLKRFDHHARQQIGSVKRALPLKTRVSSANVNTHTHADTDVQCLGHIVEAHRVRPIKALSRDYWSIECIAARPSPAALDVAMGQEHKFRITSYHKPHPHQAGTLQGQLA